jgi:superfamily II DNA/RNA helicase
MREVDVKNAIIFCNRKKDVGILCRSLQRHGFSVGALHGDLDQRQRMATLDAFRNGQIAFLAASDVAARGLDIPDVSHIFNYDVPIHPEDYVHRIGRTGRAGREGYAATLVTPKDMKALKAIEKMLRYDIEWLDGAQIAAEDGEGSDPRSNGRHRRCVRSRRNKNGHAAHNNQAHRHGTQASNVRGEERRTEHSKRGEQRQGEPRREQHKQHHHHGDRKPTHGPQAAVSSERPAPNHQGGKVQPQPPRPKQQGMGDHVPAFMMRPVRIT